MMARIRLLTGLLVAVFSGSSLLRSQAPGSDGGPAPLSLIDFSSPDAGRQVAPTKGVPASVVTVDRMGIAMSFPIQPAPHSGVHVTPAAGKEWDLSAYGHVEAKVINLGEKSLPMVMHVVSDTDGWWQEVNTEAVDIPPGQTRVLTVYFGYQYGFEPSAAFHAAHVGEIYLFLYDTDQPHSFRIEELQAGGVAGEKPRLDPQTRSYKPPDGVILGEGVGFDPVKQVEVHGARVSAGPHGALAVDFTGGVAESLTIKPAIGRWDLSAANQLRVKVKNTGAAAVTPTVVIGLTKVTTPTPVASGAETEIIASFVGKASAPAPGFESDQATGFDILSDATPGAKSLLITSIVADAVSDVVPDWLGKRPPVDGDWTRTFDEEFDGSSLDLKKWNIYSDMRIPGSRGWNTNHNADRRTHFSKDNVILTDGKAILRYERKTGKQNDADAGQQTDYASGYLSTLGKWTQRYGYFEARLQLPRAPGLWAAFTLMPDRGKATTPRATRLSAAKLPTDPGAGGIEFDAMNFLSRWGPCRYNVAARDGLHGDRAIASQNQYVRADKDGYVTTGLLWTPGAAVFYHDGKEIFRWENARVGDVRSYLRFDFVIGGFNNNHVDDATLPADFVIDYVRAWQREDLASPEDGPKPNDGHPDEAKN